MTYLILTYANWDQLCTLLKMLDDERNDLYFHIDKKAAFTEREKQMIADAVRLSSVMYVPRVRIDWGAFSMVKAELNLLRAATAAGQYDYYHLLSGTDLPLKTQDEIHAFFDAHAGKEFIAFSKEPYEKRFLYRLKYDHYFQRFIGRPDGKRKLSRMIFVNLENASIAVQKHLGVDHLSGIRFGFGSQWFSITDGFARHLLQNEKMLTRRLRFGMVSDEMLMQIAVLNSPFAEACQRRNMRHIDWSRGQPYTFRTADYQELLATDDLFARKFDETVDPEIIGKLYGHALIPADDAPEQASVPKDAS